MDEYILKKNKITEFLEFNIQNSDVFAPVQRDDIVTFDKIENTSNIILDYPNSDIPPKNILFPQTEELFCFSMGKKQSIKSDNVYSKCIIFGIRPCDAHGFSILDRVFKKDFLDQYYLNKREQAILIGLACTTPDATCFCNSVNGGPGNKEHTDILLTPLDDEYFVEVVTDRGKSIIQAVPHLFTEANENQAKKKQEIKKRSENLIKQKLSLSQIEQHLDRLFDSKLWNDIAMKCLGCSVCTYLCPTCHCFDIQDQADLNNGKRIRIWDSCSNPEYTMHASGHNPRPARMNRLRNRIYHKYNYYPKNFDAIACVGCGRCIVKCPVNIDIMDVLCKVKQS